MGGEVRGASGDQSGWRKCSSAGQGAAGRAAGWTRLARALKVHTDERAWRIGADAEENVGGRLDRLARSEWLALHDIVLNDEGTNLDHLVIGSAGIFSLNTKHHPKKKVVVTERGFRVNGYRTSYLPAAVSEAAKVAKVLQGHVTFPVFVRPVIVVWGAELEVRKMPPDVSVIRRRDLPKWFKRLPAALPSEQVKELRARWRGGRRRGGRRRSWWWGPGVGTARSGRM